MSSKGKGCNDDCYFYYYSSCRKGESCPFRHCEAALGSEMVCSLWRKGQCFRDDCKFRHMECRLQANRKATQCYFEDQPSGCLKPHCVFYHRKPRHNLGNSSTRNEGLILPVSTSGLQASSSPKLTEVNKGEAKNITFNPVKSYSNSIEDEMIPPLLPVEPIVINFDEESDSESASSTPMKSECDPKYNPDSAKRDLVDRFKDLRIDDDDEIIRMVKILTEPDIYGTAYDAPLIDPVASKMNSESYPPYYFNSMKFRNSFRNDRVWVKSAEFLKNSYGPAEYSVKANTEQYSSDTETGIGSRLSKRVLHPTDLETSAPPKKMVCLKKSQDEPSNLKFKTIYDIRQERRNKSSKKEELAVIPKGTGAVSTVSNSTNISTLLQNLKTESTNISGKCFSRMKINRQSNESTFDTNASQEAHCSTENKENDDPTQMVIAVHKAEDQKKTDIRRKRKQTDDVIHSECISPKLFKSELSSTSSTRISPSDFDSRNPVGEMPLTKSNRWIIKGKRSSAISMPPTSASESGVSSIVTQNGGSLSFKSLENESPKREVPLPSAANTETKRAKTSVNELDNLFEEILDYEPDLELVNKCR